MGQPQTRVSFSVGTKLLISVVMLLFVVIVFLNVSTILLVTEDKRAYTYQAQSTEAVLAGREFVTTAKHALDSLRLSLASVDPLQPITPQQTAALQSLLNNQSEVIGTVVGLLEPFEGKAKILAQLTKADALKGLDISEAELMIPADWMKERAPALLENAYTFVNLSKPGKVPLLGVALADIKLKKNPTGVPIAFGFVPLTDFGKDLKSSQLTIADRDGWVLFDSDPTAFFTRTNVGDDPLFDSALSSQLATGAKEYTFDNKHLLGSYVRPGFDLVVLTHTDWRLAMRATYALTERYILLGTMATAAAVMFALLFAHTLTAPLNRLYEATKEVAAGNFNVRLMVKTRDEIGALTGSFVAMSHKINDLINESVRKVHLENELAIASTVQQTLIPPSVYQDEEVYIRSHYQSAAECGGDWWGFFRVGHRLCLMISDATGHGLPCALITASARSCFSVMHKLAQEDPEFSFSPGAMLSYANRVIHDAAQGKLMMTFFVCAIDFEQGTLTYASAGHNPPWHFSLEDGNYKLNSLMSVGPRVGESPNVADYEEHTINVGTGDILFLYTDGLLEGRSKGGEFYGKKKARRLIESKLAAGPDALIETLVKDFLTHNEGKQLDDDLTLAAIKLLKVAPHAARSPEPAEAPAETSAPAEAGAPVLEPMTASGIDLGPIPGSDEPGGAPA